MGEVESVTEQSDQLSPFIWSDAIEAKESEKNKKEQDGEADGNVDEGYEPGEPDYKMMHRSKQWTSEWIRKIMQGQSDK